MAVEQPVQRPSGLGGFFTRPFAGIPVWGWLGIGIVGVGAAWFFFWRKGAALGSSATGGSGTADTSTAGGLAIDPSSGLPYGTNGQGGLNPAGAFAGETQYDPFANTNSLLQQILNQNQNNVNPPTTGGSGTTPNGLINGYATSNGETLNQIAARYGLSGQSLYYSGNPALVSLRNLINQWWTQQGKPGKSSEKFAHVVIPKGTPVYIGTPGNTGNTPIGTQIGNPPKLPAQPVKLVA